MKSLWNWIMAFCQAHKRMSWIIIAVLSALAVVCLAFLKYILMFLTYVMIFTKWAGLIIGIISVIAVILYFVLLVISYFAGKVTT
jgi:hypothetical protein